MRKRSLALLAVAATASPLLLSGCDYDVGTFGPVPAEWIGGRTMEINPTGIEVAGGIPVLTVDPRLQQWECMPLPFPGCGPYPSVRASSSAFTATDPKLVVNFGNYGKYWNGVTAFPLRATTPREVVSNKGIEVQGRYFKTGLTVSVPLAWDPPTARLFSRTMPAAVAGPVGTIGPTVLDARDSTGPGTLVFSWDLNGDGTFGDAVQGGWADSPAPAPGTAYLPIAAMPGGQGTVPVAVRVTTAASRSTASLDIPYWSGGAGGGFAFRAGSDERVQPETGTLETNRAVTGHVQFACLDMGSDGIWDGPPEDTFPVFGMPGVYGFSGNWLVTLRPGTTPVTIAYFGQRDAGSDCTAASPISTVRFNVTKDPSGDITSERRAPRGALAATATATRPTRARGYRTPVRLRLGGGRIHSMGTFDADTSSTSGILTSGRFSLIAPPRARGVRRPAPLSAIRNGSFAATSDAKVSVGSGGSAANVSTGRTTVLVRGPRGALGCFRVVRTDTTTTWTFAGGTGAASRLGATLSGGATRNSAMNDLARGMNVAPAATTYTANATTRRKQRALPADCSALRKMLPRRARR